MRNFIKFTFGIVVAIFASAQANAVPLVSDTFTYAPGNLTNAPSPWVTHNGVGTDIQVVSGGLAKLAQTNAPDDNLAIPGGPHSNDVLYAGFEVNFSALPAGSTYFSMFKDASTANFFARVYATNDAGFVRLGIGDQSTIPGAAAISTNLLSLGTTYCIVVKFDQTGTSTSTLWIASSGIDMSEIDPNTVSLDTAAVQHANIVGFGLRQSGGIGILTMDNLNIATTFEEVACVPEPSTMVLLGGGLLGLLALRRRRS